eukprot:gb/GEZN01011229.1/.p1 GENE.gb/GEZN01011229.1/~~gb/GEZN01011229.1/.p1  ORF type:complete len:247 (-),score=22.96 gb/GEZN01011229.1/:405-1145(-)
MRVNRCLLAGLTIVATSGDDTLFLLPFIASTTRSWYRRCVNMTVWLLTLVSLVAAAQIVVVLGIEVDKAGYFTMLLGPDWTPQLSLGLVGVIFVWLVMVLLLSKWLCKRYKRRMAKKHKDDCDSNYNDTNNNYGVKSVQPTLEQDTQLEVSSSSGSSDACTIIALTIMGGLDEIAYFPSLLLTQTFSLSELCVGSVLAGTLLLLILQLALAQCRFLLDFLDRIPLWCIVAVYAIVMTVGFLVELYE